MPSQPLGFFIYKIQIFPSRLKKPTKINLYIKENNDNSKVCKFIQKQLVDKIFKSPNSQKRWSEKLNEITFDWKDAYLSPLKSSLSTRLRYFQYRLLHRILGVNEYTCKIGLIDSNLCSFCSLSVETIPHLFWDCPVTHKFLVGFTNACSRQHPY